jgi:hypothetical protein
MLGRMRSADIARAAGADDICNPPTSTQSAALNSESSWLALRNRELAAANQLLKPGARQRRRAVEPRETAAARSTSIDPAARGKRRQAPRRLDQNPTFTPRYGEPTLGLPSNASVKW